MSRLTESRPAGVLIGAAESAPRAAAPVTSALRLVIVAEVCLYREGLAASLARRAEAEVVGTASGRAEAVEVIRGTAPDVVLLDMETGDAPSVVRETRAACPDARVVALAISETADSVLACAEAGVAGYVSRSATLDDLVGTLVRVARGELVCPPRIAASLFMRVGALSGARREAACDSLTPREREILGLIDQGLSNKEISRRLRIGLSTVKNHVHNILEKLGVSRRGAAAARLRRASADSSAS